MTTSHYKVCGECGHVWRDRESLVRDVQKMDRELRVFEPTLPDTDPDTLTFCPLCSEEF